MLASIQITAQLRCACPRACTAARTHARTHACMNTHTCTHMHTYTSGARMHRWTDSVCTNRHKSYTTSHGNDQVKDNTLILQEELGQASPSHTHANTHARTRVWRVCSCTSTQAHTNAHTHVPRGGGGSTCTRPSLGSASSGEKKRKIRHLRARTHARTHARTLAIGCWAGSSWVQRLQPTANCRVAMHPVASQPTGQQPPTDSGNHSVGKSK